MKRIGCVVWMSVSIAAVGCGTPGEEANARLASSAHALTITKLEVNQALGVQLNGEQSFVAGKDTALVAYLSDPTDVEPTNAQLVIARDGVTVATILAPAATQAMTVTFQCPSMDACGSWAAGNYTFAASIAGQSSTATATLVRRRGLRVLAVPIKVAYNSGVKTLGENHRWKTTVDFVRAAFPIASNDLQWIVRDELDLSSLNVETEAGQAKVWQALTDLNPASCAANKRAPECYDYIAGFIKERPNGTLQGYTMGLPAVVNVNDDEDVAATLAHEMAHPLGLGDEYNGGQFNCVNNPVPPSYVGKNFNAPNEQSGFSCPGSTEVAAETIDAGAGVAVLAASSHPFDPRSRGLLPDVAGFMGSGGRMAQYWVSPRQYSAVFKALDPAVPLPSAIVPIVGIEAEVRKVGANYAAEIEPLYTFDGPSPGTPASKGEWYAQALDGSNAELAFSNATVDFFPSIDPPRDATEVPFRADLPLPTGTTKIRLKHHADTLVEIAVTPNKPVASLAGVVAGQTVSGTQTIQWTMSDADPGDDLKATLEYSANEGVRWDVLADDLDGTSAPINFDELPGGGEGKSILRLVVTDGVNTTVATTPRFTVAIKAPEVDIEEPRDDAAFVFGNTVTFEGIAFDEYDGDLTSPSELAWSSDRDGRIGTGAVVRTRSLAVGPHVVTLTAKNSAGLEVRASVRIRITGDTADGGTTGDAASPSGPDATAPADGGAPAPAPSAAAPSTGCGCRVVTHHGATAPAGVTLALLCAALVRRRRRG